MALPSFPVVGDLRDILGNVSSSELVESDLSATIEFLSNIPDDHFIVWDGKVEKVRRVVARASDDGIINVEDGEPLRLLANDPGLSVESIQWRVTINLDPIFGSHSGGRMRSFWIDALEDDETLDLATAVPVPNAPVSPASNGSGPPTWNTLGGKPFDDDNKLLAANLPNLAIIDYLGTSANQAAMLAKTGQKGDWTIRTDTGAAFIISGSDPTQLASWTQLPYPAETWSTLPGKPTTFPPHIESAIETILDTTNGDPQVKIIPITGENTDQIVLGGGGTVGVYSGDGSTDADLWLMGQNGGSIGLWQGAGDAFKLNVWGNDDTDLDVVTQGNATLKHNGRPVQTAINRFNVRDFGAVGDGVADDSAAFLAAYTAAQALYANMTSLMGYTAYFGQAEIYIPAGRYKIVTPEAMLGTTAGGIKRGLKYTGAGRDSTAIIFSPSTDDEYLMHNDDEYLGLTFEGMSFYSTEPTASFMKCTSTGSGTGWHIFNEIFWGGTWKYGFELIGTDNNDHMTWRDCGIMGDWTAFLYASDADGSDQFLEYNFFGCHPEMRTGNFIDMAKGGNINVYGGSFLHLGDATATTSSEQVFFKLRGGSHANGVCNLSVQGIRVEHRHNNSVLVDSEWFFGTLLFQNVDADCMENLGFYTPTTLESAKFKGIYTPAVVFDNCKLMGKHEYHYRDGSQQHRGQVVYRSCEFYSVVTPTDFITYVNDDATGNITGKPTVRFENCYSPEDSVVNTREIWDCTLPILANSNFPVERRTVFPKHPWGGQDFVGLGLGTKVNLPLGAMITRVFASDPAGGSDSSTTWSYVVRDADATVIATVTGGGAAWNAAWEYDSGLLQYRCSTNNKRQIIIDATVTTGSSAETLIGIEYLA